MTADETRPDDTALGWSLACNCLLYESDPGPVNLNVGSRFEPKMVNRREAWRELYARLLIDRLNADIDRIGRLQQDSRRELADSYHPEHWERIYQRRLARNDPATEEVLTPKGQQELQEAWECVIDLCQQAARMIREAGAADDPQVRERFLAGVRHQNTVDVLGDFPILVQDSADDLAARLDEPDKP